MNHVLRSATNIVIASLMYRMTCVIRDLLQANSLGATVENSAFIYVFKLSNVVRKLLAEGSCNAILVPMIIAVMQKQSMLITSRFMSFIFCRLFMFIIFAILVGFINYGAIIHFFLPGLVNNIVLFDKVVFLGKIGLIHVGLTFCCAFFVALLHSVGVFASTNLSYIIVNIITIIGFGCCHIFGNKAFYPIIATVIGGIIQILILYLISKRYNWQITFNMRDRAIDYDQYQASGILYKIFFSIVGSSIWQINMCIAMAISSFLPHTIISYIYYADHLMEFPNSLIALSIGSAILPYISKIILDKDFKKSSLLVTQCSQIAMKYSMLIMILFLLLAKPLVSFFYYSDKLTLLDQRNTALALQYFVYGLPAYSLSRILNAVFFAHNMMFYSLLCGISAIFCNAVCATLAVYGYGFAWISIGMSVSVWVNAILLFIASYFVCQTRCLLTSLFIIKLILCSLLTYIIGYSSQYCIVHFFATNVIYSIFGVGIISLNCFLYFFKKLQCHNEQDLIL